MRVNPPAAMAALNIQRREAMFGITLRDKPKVVKFLGNFHQLLPGKGRQEMYENSRAVAELSTRTRFRG